MRKLYLGYITLVGTITNVIYKLMLYPIGLNGVLVFNTRVGHDTRMTSVGYVSVKCPIQKVFVRFLTIIVHF